MARDLLYTVAHPVFYEELSRYSANSEFRDRIQPMLTGEWRFDRRSLWLHVSRAGQKSSRQGFKIHVSSTPTHACGVLDVIVPELVERGISFKLTADRRLLRLLNSKPYDRGGSGKFMTLYPTDEQQFRELIDTLHRLTKDTAFVGPYILSDRRYKDSRILYYRYGGIMPRQRLTVDGLKHSFLEAPDGSTIRDYRYPYFKLPDWVEDPFGGSREVDGEQSPLLGGRFRVESMRAVSNRGGVYEAFDVESGSQVIVKEARPWVNHVELNGHTIDSTVLLDREYRTLTRLQHSGRTPKPIAVFEEWEHRFLAQELIAGTVLRKWVVRDGYLILPYILRPGVLSTFLPTFRQIGLELIAAVNRIHMEGIIIGDLSQNNVIVDDNTRVWLIDLESAVSENEEPAILQFAKDWYTPGFARPDRKARERVTYADDHYSVGMILFSMFIGGLEFFTLKPEGREQILDELVRLGLPPAAREAIVALMEGEATHAERALRSM